MYELTGRRGLYGLFPSRFRDQVTSTIIPELQIDNNRVKTYRNNYKKEKMSLPSVNYKFTQHKICDISYVGEP